MSHLDPSYPIGRTGKVVSSWLNLFNFNQFSSQGVSENPIGIGIDLIEISKIEEVLDRYSDSFPRRVLSPSELEVFYRLRSRKRKVEMLAGRWAIKEALTKALSSLLGRDNYLKLKLNMRDVTFMPPGELRVPRELPGITLIGSITHTDSMALGIVIAFSKDQF